MRLLWYWIGWLALVVYATTLERGALFTVFLWLLALLFVLLLGLTGWGLLRTLIGRMRHAAREQRIKRRDATTESPLERAIAQRLDRLGIEYEREYPISRTHVDFAFPKARLVVECDGYRYHHDRQKEDAARDAFLRRKGWQVLRFSGDQIRADADGCVQKIRERL